jgi:DNA replication protein DnaC
LLRRHVSAAWAEQQAAFDAAYEREHPALPPEAEASRWRRAGMEDGKAPQGFDVFRPAMQPTPEARKQAAAALAAFALWASGKGKSWLLCIGPVGCGKTMLMKAALRCGVMARGTGYYLTGSNFNRRVKDFTDEPHMVTPDEYVERLAALPGQLLLDDIGAGYYDRSGYTMSRLEQLLSMRYEVRLPLAIATNLGAVELQEHLGARAFSRLSDRALCERVQMDKCGDVRPALPALQVGKIT